MGKIRAYNVTLDEEVIEEARKQLTVGEKLSPIINDLLKKWAEKRMEEKKNN